MAFNGWKESPERKFSLKLTKRTRRIVFLAREIIGKTDCGRTDRACALWNHNETSSNPPESTSAKAHGGSAVDMENTKFRDSACPRARWQTFATASPNRPSSRSVTERHRVDGFLVTRSKNSVQTGAMTWRSSWASKLDKTASFARCGRAVKLKEDLLVVVAIGRVGFGTGALYRSLSSTTIWKPERAINGRHLKV